MALAASSFTAKTATVQTAPQAAPTGSIRGTVVREGSTEPLANVQISLSAGSQISQATDPSAMNFLLNSGLATFGPGVGITDGDAKLAIIEQSAARAGVIKGTTTISDAEGHFAITDLKPGSYTVAAILDGYFASAANGISSTISRANVTIAAGQAGNVELTMAPGGTISGRVLDALGKPAIEASVQMLRATYSTGSPVLQIAAATKTDDRGEYRLYRQMPGDYYIGVNARSMVATGLTAEINVRTYFPNVTDLTQASQIRLHGGEEINGTNIGLRVAKSAKIFGQVLSSIPAAEMISTILNGRGGAAPAPNATLTLLQHGSNVLQEPGSNNSITISMSDPANGHFNLSDVPPGIYDLFASLPDIKGYGPMTPPSLAGSTMGFGRTVIDVHGEDREGVTVLVHHGIDIQGRVTVDGGTPSSVDNVRLSLQPDDSSSKIQIYQQVGRFQPKIDKDGTFTFPAVPEARYRFKVSFGVPLPMQTPMTELENALSAAGIQPTNTNPAPAASAASSLASSTYVADILQRGRSVYDNGIVVGAESVDPIEVLVKTNGGSISGVVLGARQAPAPRATVVLVPQSAHRQNPAAYKSTMSDANGQYSIPAIPPGEYKLFAWDNIQPGIYQDAEFLANYEDKGVAVSVAGAIQLNSQISLITVKH